MVELSTVLRDLRTDLGLAHGADVPQELVARALTERIVEQVRPTGRLTRSPAEGTDTTPTR